MLAVFVFERLLAWREERRWLTAKDWLYMFLLETIDDLLKRLLPAAVAREGAEAGGEIPVYEAAGERVHFGEAVAYDPLRLLVSPDGKDLQSYVPGTLWNWGRQGTRIWPRKLWQRPADR